ncbi:MAG: heavy-metal-associated domain-containing protein [Planctomycetota bacterium]
MGCVTTVRGALDRVDGVYGVDIESGNQDITVHYKPDMVEVDTILSALETAGESATRR